MLIQRLKHKGTISASDFQELHRQKSRRPADLQKYMAYCLETCQEMLAEAQANPVRLSTGSS